MNGCELSVTCSKSKASGSCYIHGSKVAVSEGRGARDQTPDLHLLRVTFLVRRAAVATIHVTGVCHWLILKCMKCTQSSHAGGHLPGPNGLG
jgi:hypothetical protein